MTARLRELVGRLRFAWHAWARAWDESRPRALPQGVEAPAGRYVVRAQYAGDSGAEARRFWEAVHTLPVTPGVSGVFRDGDHVRGLWPREE